MKAFELRMGFLYFGVFISAVGDILFSWFSIDYHPAGTAYMYHIEYNIYAQLEYLGSGVPVTQLKEYYGSLAATILLAFIYAIDTEWIKKILEHWLTKTLFNFANISTLLYAVYVNVINKSIIRAFSPSYLRTYFGTSDVSYILNNSTVTLELGFYLALVGCLSIAIGIYSYDVMLTKTPSWVYTLLFISVMLGCCGFGVVNVNQGKFLADSSKFYLGSHHVNVFAAQGWQNTRLLLEPGDAVWILNVPHTGLWTADRVDSAYTDASGRGEAAQTNVGLILPSAPMQALIARVGAAQPFYVGNGITFLAWEKGPLELRMNHADSTLARSAGQVETLIAIYRYMSGRTITIQTVKVTAAQTWQDTGVNRESGDKIGISYVFNSGVWANSDALVAPDGQNGAPPTYEYFYEGDTSGSPLPPAQHGLNARIGGDPAFYCGYSIIAPDLSPDGGDILVRLTGADASTGSVQVKIVKIHLDTLSTAEFV